MSLENGNDLPKVAPDSNSYAAPLTSSQPGQQISLECLLCARYWVRHHIKFPCLYKAKGVIVLLGEGSNELISHNLVWEHQQTKSEDSKREQDKIQRAKVT